MDSKMNEVEDFLQARNVFISGINGRSSHMDAYMTILDFPTFDKALENPPFTKEELLKAAEEMMGFAYLSPMACLTAKLIRKKYL